MNWADPNDISAIYDDVKNNFSLYEVNTQISSIGIPRIEEKWIDNSTGDVAEVMLDGGLVDSINIISSGSSSAAFNPYTGTAAATNFPTQWEDETYYDPIDHLRTLLGSCVACGGECDGLFCSDCGVALKELGKKKLIGTMKEIQEELG